MVLNLKGNSYGLFKGNN